MMKTAKEITDGLITMQKDYKEAAGRSSSGHSESQNNIFIAGGPTDILKEYTEALEALEKQNNTIDVEVE
jgi:hypothetical protein